MSGEDLRNGLGVDGMSVDGAGRDAIVRDILGREGIGRDPIGDIGIGINVIDRDGIGIGLDALDSQMLLRGGPSEVAEQKMSNCHAAGTDSSGLRGGSIQDLHNV